MVLMHSLTPLFSTSVAGSLLPSMGTLFVEPYTTYRLQSSSFLGLPYRILNMNNKKELLMLIEGPGTHIVYTLA